MSLETLVNGFGGFVSLLLVLMGFYCWALAFGPGWGLNVWMPKMIAEEVWEMERVGTDRLLVVGGGVILLVGLSGIVGLIGWSSLIIGLLISGAILMCSGLVVAIFGTWKTFVNLRQYEKAKHGRFPKENISELSSPDWWKPIGVIFLGAILLFIGGGMFEIAGVLIAIFVK